MVETEGGDEIDVSKLVKVVWLGRKHIFKITASFLAFGLLFAIVSKVEYKASCKLLPESQEGSMPDLGGLGGLAGLAGFDLSNFGSQSSVLTPELYPEMITSVPFMEKLINTPIYFENKDTTISSLGYFRYLEKRSLLELIAEYTVGLPNKISSLFKSGVETQKETYGLYRFSKDEWELIESYKDRFSVEVDANTGIIEISSEMPDPVAAAHITKILIDHLTNEITEYKTERVSQNLEFISAQFEEARNEYEATQLRLARFTDRNRNITTSIIQTEYQRLQNEMNIAFEVYKGLATQLEQSKIKVKEETPVFTILEPIKIPIDKNKPKRKQILIIFLLIGVAGGSFFVILKNKDKIIVNSKA